MTEIPHFILQVPEAMEHRAVQNRSTLLYHHPYPVAVNIFLKFIFLSYLGHKVITVSKCLVTVRSGRLPKQEPIKVADNKQELRIKLEQEQ